MSSSMLIRHGSFRIFEPERMLMLREAGGKFQKHPQFAGAEIRQLQLREIPKWIKAAVHDVHGSARQFFAIKAARGIPMHQHTDDREIYFGGFGGRVVFQNQLREEIGRFVMQPNFYSVVDTGNWHGVEANQEIVFFGVKFSPKI